MDDDLNTQLKQWIRRTSHVRRMLDPILTDMSPDQQFLLNSGLAGLKDALSDYVAEPPSSETLAEAVRPFREKLQQFQELTSVERTADLFAWLREIRECANEVYLTLTTDESLRFQTVREIVDDFAEEYRTTLVLALTANYHLSRLVTEWQRAKASGRSPGDHLDLTTFRLAAESGPRTVSMSTLASDSVGEPFVLTPSTMPALITPESMAALMQEALDGDTPPPLYRLAYTQWLTSIAAAWEDVYRPRLAKAHGKDDEGNDWEKDDIRSAFFNELRLIRNDISHKQGVCIDSAGNEIIDWVEFGEEIAPTPKQMLRMLDLFPYEELMQPPVKEERQARQLPYSFPIKWVKKVERHVASIEPVRKKRPDVLRKLIDEWMNTSAEPDNG